MYQDLGAIGCVALEFDASNRPEGEHAIRMNGDRPGSKRGVRVLLVGLVVMATLLTADFLSSFFYHTDTTMSTIRSGPKGISSHTLLVFPGYAGDCRSVSEAFRPHLDSTWTLVVLCYGERGVDDEQVFSLLGSDIEEASEGTVYILAGSMGGMVAANFLHRLASSGSSTVPKVRLFLDTSPPDSEFVKRPGWLLDVSGWYRGGAIASGMWMLANRSPDHSALEPGASLEAVLLGDRYFREIGMPALTSQAQYIHDFKLDDTLEFRRVVSSAVFIASGDSAKDPLVEVESSIEAWRLLLPQLDVVELSSRQGNWHIPWAMRPKEVLSVVTEKQ